MNTLPTDLLSLLDLKLNPYETLLLHFKATDIEKRWFWYNYHRGTLGFEIIKLCKKADKESVKILKEIIQKGSFKLGNEQIFQMKMLALRIGDDLLWNMIPEFNNSVYRVQSIGLSEVVYTEAILYGRENSMKCPYNTSHLYMNKTAQLAVNALKVGNMQLLKQFMDISGIANPNKIVAIMLNPDHFDIRAVQLDDKEHQFILRWSIIINRLDIFTNIIKHDKVDYRGRHFQGLADCAFINKSHEIIEYIFRMTTTKSSLCVQKAHEMGYYYRPFWDTVVSVNPLLIYSLDLFQPLDDGEKVVIGTSMDRIELDNLKMLFELAPPSKRELYRLIQISREYKRYDIYCWCWELIMNS